MCCEVPPESPEALRPLDTPFSQEHQGRPASLGCFYQLILPPWPCDARAGETRLQKSKGWPWCPQLDSLGRGVLPCSQPPSQPLPEPPLQVAHMQTTFPRVEEKGLFLSHSRGHQLPEESQGKWIPTTNLTSSESPPAAPCQESDKASQFAPSSVLSQGSPNKACLSTQQAFISFSHKETETRHRT